MKMDALPNILFTTQSQSIERSQSQGPSFTHWLVEKIADTNTQLNQADTALLELASGRTDNLHQTMISLEEAKLSFQFMEQIRNRLMTAYQDLLREQI